MPRLSARDSEEARRLAAAWSRLPSETKGGSGELALKGFSIWGLQAKADEGPFCVLGFRAGTSVKDRSSSFFWLRPGWTSYFVCEEGLSAICDFMSNTPEP